MSLPNTHWTAIQMAQAGNTNALEALVERYRPAVFRYMTRRGLAAEAEDLTQEVFLRLFTQEVLQRADQGKGRFRGLLFGLARNVLGHHLERVRAKKRKVRLVSLQEEQVSAEEEFDRVWVRNLVRRALEQLKTHQPHFHEAIRLFSFEGQSQAEVAQQLGRSVGDIKNHVKRGKAKLGEYVKEEIRDYCASPAEFTEELSLLKRYIP